MILRVTRMLFMIRFKRKEIQRRFTYPIGGEIQNGWFALLQKTNENDFAGPGRKLQVNDIEFQGRIIYLKPKKGPFWPLSI